MTRPFDLEELCARTRAMQRRSKERAKPIISHDDITLNPASASRVVTLKKKEVMVSRREFMLLQKLLENARRVILREQLNQTVYDWGKILTAMLWKSIFITYANNLERN